VSELAAGRITIATAKPFNRRISDDAPRRSCSCLGWRELRRRLSLLRRHAVKRSTALGLAGEVIYSDNDAVDEGLVSHRYGLTGKPDYISREGEELIPVERKSRGGPGAVFASMGPRSADRGILSDGVEGSPGINFES
jgi:hypothetical protein